MFVRCCFVVCFVGYVAHGTAAVKQNRLGGFVVLLFPGGSRDVPGVNGERQSLQLLVADC